MRAPAQLIGATPEMEKLQRIVQKVGGSAHSVLILGESGSGKEVVARTIHLNGPHAAKPFLPVDCGALPPGLMESELFGHVPGAFTSANRVREGLLVSAGEGTVFLDEITELPLDVQVKLLHALQDHEVKPVGSAERVPFSARVLAGSNRDLPAMVEQGSFRRDLYFRLNVVSLRIPPLRERRDDIPLLARYFLERLERERGEPLVLSDETLKVFAEYDWPGNVRELENAVERLIALNTGRELNDANLPTQLKNFRRSQKDAEVSKQSSSLPQRALPNGVSAVTPIAEMEKQAIIRTIRKLKGDKLMAARLLGIGKTTLYRKLKEYGLEDELDK
ncbi:MAG: hypothetical protein NVSMB3_15480 [Acidobacteriaceae bacterium]